MDLFKTVLNLTVKYQTVLGYGALSLLAAGGEHIFSLVVFSCPCDSWNFMYSLVFLLVPALILFLLGYLLNIRMWRLLTGCCTSNNCCHRLCGAGLHCRCLWMFWQLTYVSALAPLTWIALALLNGGYYQCAVTGQQRDFIKERLCINETQKCVEELLLLPCAKSLELTFPHQQVDLVQRRLMAESQVLGWILVACIMLIVAVFACISRCRSPVSYLQLTFWKTYIEKEQELFNQKTNVHATKLAERNLKSFFEHTIPEPFPMPNSQEWQKISSLYAFSNKQQHYSMIHKFVELASRNNSIISSEGDAVPPTELNFIDIAGIAESGL
ncbi:hypothetical protein FKM82_010967 [Ascaphus truei]